jgi:hypothetical protein
MAVFIRRIATWLEQQRQKEKQLFEETRRRIEAETIWSAVGKTVISTQDLDLVLSLEFRHMTETKFASRSISAKPTTPVWG